MRAYCTDNCSFSIEVYRQWEYRSLSFENLVTLNCKRVVVCLLANFGWKSMWQCFWIILHTRMFDRDVSSGFSLPTKTHFYQFITGCLYGNQKKNTGDKDERFSCNTFIQIVSVIQNGDFNIWFTKARRLLIAIIQMMTFNMRIHSWVFVQANFHNRSLCSK